MAGPLYLRSPDVKSMRNLLLTLSVFLVLPQASYGQATPPGNPVAIVGGQPISERDLLDALGPQLMQLRNQEYEAKSKVLESLVRHKIVEVEAKKRNISPEKLIEREVDSKVADPTDVEIEAYFIGQNREGARLEDVKEQYRNTLKQFKLVKARQAYADSLRAKMEVAVLMRPPSIDVAFDPARVKGDPKAPVTIVEFSDYQCPFCKKTESVLHGLLDKYNGRVKLAYMDFPLREIHPRAESAAEASRCAGEQGKFWEFHDSLFADAAKLDDPDLIARARTLGLQEKPFRACLASGKFKRSVDADREAGIKAGVVGTPGFFINGVFLSGAQSQAEFERMIDTQLSFSGNKF
jgi:protein-disulfide isomerase